MLAWKPLQKASAFKTYCRGIGIEANIAEKISSNLDEYAEDKKWKPIIEESKRFIGVIDSVSESPCSMLLYNKPVRKELGLIRTKKGQICCLLDGYNCDKYKYLKNDYLTVTVWAIIRDVCKLANIPIPTIDELNNLLDDKTYDIYAQGLTSTINQADSDFATGLVKRYKPKSVGEMSAFVAIIRPGCAKLLQDFVDRKPYTTGVKELDELLIEGNHRMIYQELIMKYLIWLGIPETGSYDIIKKISKKKFKEAELAELKEKLYVGWQKQVGTEEGFEGTWQIVQDAARYSFNASHSLAYAYDSLYGAYLKSHYPLEYYTVALNYYSDDMPRTNRLISELPYFGISLKPIKFRYSRDVYSISKEDNSIYKGIKSVKDMSKDVADELFELGKEEYNSFVDLLYDIKLKTNIGQSKIKALIELGFFEEFGDTNKLLKLQKFFEHYYDKEKSIKQINKSLLDSEELTLALLSEQTIKKITAKIVTVNVKCFLKDIENHIKYKPRSIYENVQSQIIYLGYSTLRNPLANRIASVVSVDTKYSPKLDFYSIKNGSTTECKITKKNFGNKPLIVGDVVVFNRIEYQPKRRMNENGVFVDIPNTKEIWIKDYDIILPAPRKEKKKK